MAEIENSYTRRMVKMAERWIIAFAPESSRDGKYLYVRDGAGDIAVFPSRTSAQMWVCAHEKINNIVSDIVYLKLPEKRTQQS
ncbi:MAG TPA: hypothetical protein PLM29_09395 [Deltaproteobacteria bacterium]|nr:hypothetical protein [Deltaproteobacteria bacterium]